MVAIVDPPVPYVDDIDALLRKLLAEECAKAGNDRAFSAIMQMKEGKNSPAAVALKAMRRMVEGPGNYTDKGLEWNLIDNLRWLADQDHRPDHVPCGMLFGQFLNAVAIQFSNQVAEIERLKKQVNDV